MKEGIEIIILAAGLGTRMKSTTVKVLHRAAGRPIIDYVVDLAKQISDETPVVIVGHQREAVKKIGEVNAGIYVFGREHLFDNLVKLSAHNAQGEYYLTDLVGMLQKSGQRIGAMIVDDPVEAIGINSRSDLATVEEIIQRR